MQLRRIIQILFYFSLPLGLAAHANTSAWIALFNGKDLQGWTPKITGHALGENYRRTFRAEDGVLKVSYKNYERFDSDFGHLFYKEPFSNYHLRLEYRFTGKQTPGAPEWALRNAGVMFHAQPPESMRVDQHFPVCVELQILGGNGEDPRPTGNMCSPGSHITRNGEIITDHCIYSSSSTFHGDQWVKLELIVNQGQIQHIINGETVFEYQDPILDNNDPDAKKLLAAGAEAGMSQGYLALQAEGHNVEYRNIEIRRLDEESTQTLPESAKTLKIGTTNE